MKTYTHRNHFVIGFNDRPYGNRETDDDVPFACYGVMQRDPMSFRDECINTARLIRAEHDGPLWVPFSGGADSECVLRSFVAADIPVNVVIVRYANGLNQHDIEYAFLACEEMDITPLVLELDLLDLWNREGEARCRAINGGWLGIAMYGWLIEELERQFGQSIGGVPIFGNGGLLTLYDDNNYYMREREPVTALYRYLIKYNRDGIPGFYQYTPEQIYSWLIHPITKRFIEAKHEIQSKNMKAALYLDQFGAMVRPKYTGYERVWFLKEMMQSRLPRSWDGSATTEYHALLAALAPARGGPRNHL